MNDIFLIANVVGEIPRYGQPAVGKHPLEYIIVRLVYWSLKSTDSDPSVADPGINA